MPAERLRILESRAVIGIAGANQYPQLQQINCAATYVDNKQRGGSAPDINQSYTAFSDGFDLPWELAFWGRFRSGI